MPKIVGKASRVVEAPGLTIDELVGNVATGQDNISVAMVKVAAGTKEPFLTLDYDEWICVIKGCFVLEQEGVAPLEVPAGSTVQLEKGTRFRPSFPVDTEYIPVCTPAFSPARCIREDTETEEGAAIASKLNELHGK